jgi:hypothetical protein
MGVGVGNVAARQSRSEGSFVRWQQTAIAKTHCSSVRPLTFGTFTVLSSHAAGVQAEEATEPGPPKRKMGFQIDRTAIAAFN